MADNYTIKKTDDVKQHISIDFNIDGKTISKTFDARYVPTDSKESLDEFITDYVSAYRDGKAVEAVTSDEVKGLVNKQQPVKIRVEAEVLEATQAEAQV